MTTSTHLRSVGGFLAIALLVVSKAIAQQPPAVTLVTASPTSLSAAWTFYDLAANKTHTAGVNDWNTYGRPPEIVELARALGGSGRYTASNFVLAVYEYVRNNIATEFKWGLSKGARGALIDQSGTPFDQAQLMVEILRAGGLTNVSYVVGEASLTAQQFGQWTGLVTGLNESTQTFSVNAQAACQFLADGGIPATVNGSTTCPSSGNLVTTGTAVVMAHVWVSYGGSNYDPSFKQNTLKAGVDLAATMGCGTASTPTCGPTILGYVPSVQVKTGTNSGGGTGNANYVVGSVSSQQSIDTQIQNYAQALQTWIQSYNATNATSLTIEGVVGGAVQNVGAALSGTLAYTVVTKETYTGDLPDSLRTQLQVQFDYTGSSGVNQTLFVDEYYGSRLRIWGYLDNSTHTTATRHMTLYLENRPLARSDLALATRFAAMTLISKPPYLNGYNLQTLNFSVFVQPQLCDLTLCDPSANYFYVERVVTIEAAYGNANQSTISHFGALQSRDSIWTAPENPTDSRHIWPSLVSIGSGYYQCNYASAPIAPAPTTFPGCREPQDSVIGATWLAESSKTLDLLGHVDQVNARVHSSLGYVMSGPDSKEIYPTATEINIQTSLSVDSVSAASDDRQAAFYTAATTMNRLEGAVLEQTFDAQDGGSPAAMLQYDNISGDTFYETNSSNYTTVTSLLTDYSTTQYGILSQFVNAGYTVITPNDGYVHIPQVKYATTGPGIGTYTDNGLMADMTGDHIALVDSKLDLKGSAGYSVNSADQAVASVKVGEYSAKDKKYFGVDLPSGGLALMPPPDITTGTGDMPAKLSFQRFYSEALDAQSAAVSVPDANQPLPEYRIADIGGGWSNNWAISLSVSSDGLAGLGRDSALNAAGAIAGLFVLRSLDTGALALRQKLASAFAANWWISSLQHDIAIVKRPPNTEVYVRLADGITLNPLPGSPNHLVASKAEEICTTGYPLGAFDYTGITYQLTLQDGSAFTFGLGSQGVCSSGFFVPSMWSFPSGYTIAFNYNNVGSPAVNGSSMSRLASVANNLGRSLSFSYDTASNSLNAVTTDTGGSIAFSENTYTAAGANSAAMKLPTTLYVTLPDGTYPNGSYLRYDYNQSPAAGPVNRRYAQVSQWFTPGSMTVPFRVVSYDSLYRVKGLTDNATPSNFTNSYFETGLYGTEIEKRADTVDPVGALTTDYFDVNQLHLSQIDPLGHQTYYSYDSARRLSRLTYPEQNYDVYTYDARSNKLSTSRYPVPGSGFASISSSSTYNEGPTVSVCVHPATCNQIATSTNTLGNITNYSYLSTGQLQRVVGPAVTAQPGGVSGSSQTDYCYSISTGYNSISGTSSGSISLQTGRIEKISGSASRVIAIAFDTGANHLNLLTSTVDPTTTLVAPSIGGGACSTGSQASALNLTTHFSFDSVGNVSLITDPNSHSTAYTYDLNRRLTTVSGSLNTLLRYCYSLDGLLLSTNRSILNPGPAVDPNVATETTTGQCGMSFNASQWQSESRTYFPTGDLQSITDANANVVRYAYDPDSRLRVTQDADGRQTASVYDLAGQKIASWKGGAGWIDSNGSPTISGSTPAPTTGTSWIPSSYTANGSLRYELYTYSANGKRTSVTDADGNATSYSLDGFDRSTRATYMDGTHDDSWFTLDGTSATARCSDSDKPCERITRSGQAIVYSYDALDRQASKSAANQGVVTTGYDLMGERLAVNKASFGAIPAHTSSATFDVAGRELSESADGVQITHLFDGAGNRTRTTWPDGYYVSYQYDALNRLALATENGTTELASYAYDPLSRRQYACFGGQSASCASGGGTNKASYAYDANGNLNQLTNALNGTTLTLGYLRNHSGQVSTITSNDDFYLAEPPQGGAVTYTPNGLNEYSSYNGNAPTYDLNGNMLTWYPPDGSGKQTFTYDSENRLISAAVNGGSTATIVYDYDGLGRRVSKTVNGSTTIYLLDGTEEIAEYSGSTLLRRYIDAGITDERIAHAEGSAITNPTKTYYHVNSQGSILAVTDSSGNVSQRMSYDPWGNLSSGSITSGEPFRYAGRRFDPETGLYYYRARYYSPALGRFLQADPIGYNSDLNLYSYVGNDPANKTDPSGQFDCGGAMDPSCEVFLVSQDASEQEFSIVISALTTLKADLITGQLTAQDRAVAGLLNQIIGGSVGTNVTVVTRLIDDANKMLAVLKSNIPVVRQPNPTPDWTFYANSNNAGGKPFLTVYDNFFSSTPSQRTQTLAHEAAHFALGLTDIPLTVPGSMPPIVIGPYGLDNALWRARIWPNDAAWQNPDSLTFVFGFYRDDDHSTH